MPSGGENDLAQGNRGVRFVHDIDDEVVEPEPEVGLGVRPPRWWRGKWPAKGILSKVDLEEYLNQRYEEMISLSCSDSASNHEIGNDLGRQAVENGHAVLGRLGWGTLPRPSPEQLAHTGAIEAALENLLHHVNPDWGKPDLLPLAQAVVGENFGGKATPTDSEGKRVMPEPVPSNIENAAVSTPSPSGTRGGQKQGDAGQAGNTKKSVLPAKRHWTQAELDDAIRDYKAKRASTYSDLVAGVKKGLKGATRKAQEMFGRNALAKASA